MTQTSVKTKIPTNVFFIFLLPFKLFFANTDFSASASSSFSSFQISRPERPLPGGPGAKKHTHKAERILNESITLPYARKLYSASTHTSVICGLRLLSEANSQKTCVKWVNRL